MAQSALLVERLKQELKLRGITYAQVGVAIGLSEASVKRLFSKRDLTLGRLDAICAVAQIELTDLARGIDPEERLLGALTERQEATIVADPLLILVATSALNLSTFDDILETYTLEAHQLVNALIRSTASASCGCCRTTATGCWSRARSAGCRTGRSSVTSARTRPPTSTARSTSPTSSWCCSTRGCRRRTRRR